MIKCLGDYMPDIRGELKLVSKHASMVTTQVEQVLKAQKEVLDEMNSKKMIMLLEWLLELVE